MTEITVTKNDAGQRADRFLTKAYPNLAAAYLQADAKEADKAQRSQNRTEREAQRGGRVPVLPERRAA